LIASQPAVTPMMSFFDARRARIYISCGSGEIATFERDPTG
jgi:hypothetical protein